MVIKNVRCVWFKREVREFEYKGRKCQTPNQLSITFVGLEDEDCSKIEKIFEKLDRRCPLYETAEGFQAIRLDTQYNLPYKKDGNEYENIEADVEAGIILPKNMMCDVAINDNNGYIKAVKILQNGEEIKADAFNEFD